MFGKINASSRVTKRTYGKNWKIIQKTIKGDDKTISRILWDYFPYPTDTHILQHHFQQYWKIMTKVSEEIDRLFYFQTSSLSREQDGLIFTYILLNWHVIEVGWKGAEIGGVRHPICFVGCEFNRYAMIVMYTSRLEYVYPIIVPNGIYN